MKPLWAHKKNFGHRLRMIRQYGLCPPSLPTPSSCLLVKRFSKNTPIPSPNFSNQVRVDSVVERFHNLTFHLWAATPGRLITGLGQGLIAPQRENVCWPKQPQMTRRCWGWGWPGRVGWRLCWEARGLWQGAPPPCLADPHMLTWPSSEGTLRWRWTICIFTNCWGCPTIDVFVFPLN